VGCIFSFHNLTFDILQSVDTFVDELRWEETDAAKRDKIRGLKLDSDEWQRVNMFLGLLAVRLSHTLAIYKISYNNTISTPTMHNKPFHPSKSQPSTSLYLPSKHFIGHGRLVLNVRSMSAFFLL